MSVVFGSRIDVQRKVRVLDDLAEPQFDEPFQEEVVGKPVGMTEGLLDLYPTP